MWEEAWQLAKQKVFFRNILVSFVFNFQASELDGTIWDQRSVGREMLKTYVDEGRPKLAVALLREVKLFQLFCFFLKMACFNQFFFFWK